MSISSPMPRARSYIGMAGGRSLFGLKGALTEALDAPPAGATQFRCEVTMAYHTRYLELLQAYRYDHGRLPVGNIDVDASRSAISTSAESLSPHAHERSPHGSGPVRRTENDC